MSVAVAQHENFVGGEWIDSSGGETMEVLNSSIPLVSEMPHGGFKESGYGKDLSVYSLEGYTRIKHVMAKID
jgi:Aldehyde dehydrogenase family